jgi:hypothetical protein
MREYKEMGRWMYIENVHECTGANVHWQNRS